VNDWNCSDAFYFDYMVNYALGIKTLGEINLAERTLNHFGNEFTILSGKPGKGRLALRSVLRLLDGFAAKAGITLEQQRTDTTLFME
jgi:hypothetical protein